MGRFLAYVALSTLATVSWAGVVQQSGPAITLDKGKFTGVSQGPVNAFLGIPFAKPPVGDLRFRLPVANAPYEGTYNATAFGTSCIQQTGTAVSVSDINAIAAEVLEELAATTAPLDDGEDCLFVNVVTPASTTPKSKLPVVFWIYGGGFEAGSSTIYNGSAIVDRSLQLNEPVIYVSVNYRLSALGFAGSSEVREAGIGNLGLHDQRLGMRWVQKYITAFGGDPSKVTIWGESAGAISVATHLLTNEGNTEGLFRAAFMNSGSPVPAFELEQGQPFFNQFATDAGCAHLLGSVTVFDCLRKVPEATIRMAINESPNIFAYRSIELAWTPRADGNFIRVPPQHLVLQGSVAKVPFITGDCDDEGTLFSLSSSNITTNEGLFQYITEFFFQNANPSDINALLAQYPSDPAAGSPFDTGDNNTINAQFKRVSAFVGDYTFQAPRRFFLEQRSDKQPTFAFLSKRMKSTPVLGASHGTDLANVFGPGDMTDYLVRFVANLNPNGNTGIHWPQYSVNSPKLMTFLDGDVPLELTDDTYRAEAFKLVTQLSIESS